MLHRIYRRSEANAGGGPPRGPVRSMASRQHRSAVMSIKTRAISAVAAAAALLAVAVPASAASFLITLGNTPVSIPSVNDFRPQLSTLGYKAETIGGQISVVGYGKIKFEFLGSE